MAELEAMSEFGALTPMASKRPNGEVPDELDRGLRVRCRWILTSDPTRGNSKDQTRQQVAVERQSFLARPAWPVPLALLLKWGRACDEGRRSAAQGLARLHPACSAWSASRCW